MTSSKYLESLVVSYLWNKIKNYTTNHTYSRATDGSNEIIADDNTHTIQIGGSGAITVALAEDGTSHNAKFTISGSSKTAANGGTDLSVVTTGEKYTWNNKQNAITSSSKLSADLIEDGTTNKAYTATEKTKLAGIASGAEVNQNAFSNVKVGSTTVAADSKTDTLELVAGDNVTLTPDATNDKVTIAATDTQRVVYTLVYNGNIYTIKDANNTTVQYEDFIDISLNSPDKNIILRYGTSEFIYAGGDEEGVEYYCVTTNTVANVTVTTSFVSTDFYTISSPYEVAPLMDGTASAGSSTSYARGDHRHPTDTSRAPLASPALTGTPTAPTATAGTNTTQIATTAFVTSAIQAAQSGAAMYQGAAPTTFAPTNYKSGYYWVVRTAGTYAGQACEPGDMIFANTDSTTYNASHFDVIQTNLDIASMTNSEIDAATDQTPNPS